MKSEFLRFFVSHQHEDAECLGKIRLSFKELGIGFFLAHEDILVGENFHKIIKEEISNCSFFLLIANEKSKNSLFCNQEIGYALAKGKTIIPAFRHDCYAYWGLMDPTNGIKYTGVEDLQSKLLTKIQALIKEKGLHEISLPSSRFHFDLVVMNLLGSLEESSKEDQNIAGQLTRIEGKDPQVWFGNMREALQEPKSPIMLENRIWKVKDRFKVWELLGKSVFDVHLDGFRECAIQVLSRPKPIHELFLSINVKGFSENEDSQYHSNCLRKGIAETLALLRNHGEVLKECSLRSRDQTVVHVVGDTLGNADWALWASLDEVLPLMAEAAPDIFLDIVEEKLRSSSNPFDDLFFQENQEKGIFRRSYISGLLWSLETLAWNKEHLTRVTVLLGKLASRDLGGKWANRPENSLSAIFLPYFLQTEASPGEQRTAIQALRKYQPDIAWKTLFKLLPNWNSSSHSCVKPWSYSVTAYKFTNKEYQEQILFYADMVAEMAVDDVDRIIEIVGNLDRTLPASFINKILGYIESLDASEKKKVKLWNKLIDLAAHHKQYSNSKWALPKHLIEKIEEIANKITQDNLYNRRSRLFNKRDYELYEEGEDYQRQDAMIQSQRNDAVKGIYEESGLDAVIHLVENVKYPDQIGISFGSFVNDKEDVYVLNKYIKDKSDSIKMFVMGFIQGRYDVKGWEWVDKINHEGWTVTQKVLFLRSLPFNSKAWERVGQWLQNDKKEYWIDLRIGYPKLEEKEYLMAMDEFLSCNESVSAVRCLCWMTLYKLPLPPQKSIDALLKMANENKLDTLIGQLEMYDVYRIIKSLQHDPSVNLEGLFKVELAYWDILRREHDIGRTIWQKIASDPNFFHELMCYAFKSREENKQTTTLTKEQKEMASKSYDILQSWKMPPGTQPDGTFSEDKFKSWIAEALELCKASGRYEVAQDMIGGVLIHSPEDPSSLWIYRSIAEILDSEDMNYMRQGLSNGFINSRGAYIVDPTGKPEKELAEKYMNMAVEVEKRGFHRLYQVLKKLAKGYEREAQSIAKANRKPPKTDF